MCPACNAGESEPLLERGEHRYVACSACGSARLDPLPVIVPAELFSRNYFSEGTVPGGYTDYGIDDAARWSRPGVGDPAESIGGIASMEER